MRFQTVFETATYLLLLVGFLSVAAAGVTAPPIIAAFLLGLVISIFVSPFSVSRFRALLFIAAGVLTFTLDLFVGGDPVGAAVRLLLLLGLFKIFTRERDGDYLLIYLLSFALLLVSSTFNMSVSYLVMLVLFVFLGVLNLVLFESRSAYAENPRAVFSLSSYLQVSAVITLLTSVLAVPIFLAVPRGSLDFFSSPGSRLSGFSTTVRLGDLGRILGNPEVFMRVAVDRPLEAVPKNLKWRGIALDSFDGKAWLNTSRRWDEHAPDARGRYVLAKQRRFDEVLLQQTFYVEPYTEIVFGAPSIVQLSGLQSRAAHVMVDENESVLLRPRPADSSRYYVHSDLFSRGEKIQRIDPRKGVPDEVSRRFLNLPELDSRIRRMADRIAGKGTAPIQKALLLESSFRRGPFRYSLRDPSGNADDPLADFLLRTHEGHCEYYATALAVMLRIEGIPSRLVNGFRRGEYNDWGDYFIVRQSDAHSWVEGYFPGAGWIDFDPTPAVRLDAGNYFLDVTGRLFDTLDLLWSQVVTFDRIKQFGFFQLMRERLEFQWIDFRNSFQKLSGDRLTSLPLSAWLGSPVLRLAGMLLAAGLCLLLLYRYRRLLRRTWSLLIRRRIDARVAEDYYLELLEILRRKGFAKKNSETPLEFSRRVGEETGSSLPEQIVLLYYRSRFGSLHLQPGELGWLNQSLGTLRSSRG